MDYQNYDKLDLTYQHSNDEVSISFKRKIINTHNFFGDERHLNEFFVYIKLSSGDIFPDGFHVTTYPEITYYSDYGAPYNIGGLSEEDLKEYNFSSNGVEESIAGDITFGYYKIVTKELHDKLYNELGVYEDDDGRKHRYPVSDKQIEEFYSNFAVGMKEKMKWHVLTGSNIEILEFKRHLDAAISAINKPLKQTILQGGSIVGIGDAQKYLVDLRKHEVHNCCFETAERALIQQKNTKEESIKKLLSEFGLDDSKPKYSNKDAAADDLLKLLWS